MAKKRESPSVPADSKVENPRFSVSFHADGDSMADLHKKMAKAFTGKDEHPKDDSADSKKRGGRRGRSGLMKRDTKKRSKRR